MTEANGCGAAFAYASISQEWPKYRFRKKIEKKNPHLQYWKLNEGIGHTKWRTDGLTDVEVEKVI